MSVRVSGGDKRCGGGAGRGAGGATVRGLVGIKSGAGEGAGQLPSELLTPSKRLRPRAASKAQNWRPKDKTDPWLALSLEMGSRRNGWSPSTLLS